MDRLTTGESPIKLTPHYVDNARPGEARREVRDALVPGFRLVVQPSGVKSWVVRYRHGGKPCKITLGGYPALSLSEAREEARAALLVVAKDGDPAKQKRIAKQEAAEGKDRVATVVAEFLKRDAKHRRTGETKRSWPEVERLLTRNVLPSWGERQIQDIARRDVIALMDKLTDGGMTISANRTFSAIRRLFNWCIARGILDVSPCGGIEPPVPETTRDRVLTDDELRRFWHACDVLDYPYGPMFKLLAVTGQRLSEVAEMPWSELDLDKRVWSLPKERTKNARPHDLPLSDLAVEIIAAIPEMAGSRFVFTSRTGETPAAGYSRAKERLDKAVAADGGPVAPWTLHDLRRTLATGLQRLAIPPHITEAVLNHKSGIIRGVAAVYARHDYAAEKRTALDAWARWLAALVEGRPDNNVVQLSPALARDR